MHPSSSLRPFLESWRGRKFTKEELAGYDPKKLCGAPARVTLVENGDYVNIEGISRLATGEVCPPAVNKPVYFSLEKDEFNADVLATFSDKLQEKIKASPEYQRLFAPAEEAETETEAPKPTGDDVPF